MPRAACAPLHPLTLSRPSPCAPPPRSLADPLAPLPSLAPSPRLRSIINEGLDKADKVSVNDFIVKAAAKALTDVPQANSAWYDDYVRTYKHADVCVAVSTSKGLITPIIVAADLKGLKQISAETKELAGRARANKLKPEEFQGGTFTVSNLGMFGIKNFTAIINPPQACILAVGGAEKRLVSDGKVRPRARVGAASALGPQASALARRRGEGAGRISERCARSEPRCCAQLTRNLPIGAPRAPFLAVHAPRLRRAASRSAAL
jgi:hypothetical protein